MLEGAALPVVSYAFDTLSFAPVRLGSVFVASDELLRSREAEAVLLASALAAQGRAESLAFLDPTIAAVGNAPASITNGALAITATASMSADLASMLAAITTSGRGLTWLARLTDLAAIGAALGAAAPDLPRTLLGLPVIVTPTAPARQLTLADLAEVACAAAVAAHESELSSAPDCRAEGAQPVYAWCPRRQAHLRQGGEMVYQSRDTVPQPRDGRCGLRPSATTCTSSVWVIAS